MRIAEYIIVAGLLAVILDLPARADNIWEAARRGDAAAVASLVENGTDVNARDDDGQTPLHHAVAQVKLEPQRIPDAEKGLPEGEHAFTMVPVGHIEVIQYLVTKGADVNATDRMGNTPLHHAAFVNTPDVVQFLLDNGAKADVKSSQGINAIEFAKMRQETGMSGGKEMAGKIIGILEKAKTATSSSSHSADLMRAEAAKAKAETEKAGAGAGAAKAPLEEYGPGVRLVYEARGFELDLAKPLALEDLVAAATIIRKRIDADGERGYRVCVLGRTRLEIVIPASPSQGVAGPEGAMVGLVKRLVRQAGFLEFRIMADKIKDKADFERILHDKKASLPPYTAEFRWYPLKKGWDWYTKGYLDAWNIVYVVDKQTRTVEGLVNVADGQDVTGRDISRAYASMTEDEPVVSFQMKQEAAARFARLTNPEMKERHLAIIFDGTIQSGPVLKATLSTGGIIEGYRNNVRERDEVVTILNSGQLAWSLGDPVSESTLGTSVVRPEGGEVQAGAGLVQMELDLKPSRESPGIQPTLVADRLARTLSQTVVVQPQSYAGVAPGSALNSFLVHLPVKSPQSFEAKEIATTISRAFADMISQNEMSAKVIDVAEITPDFLLQYRATASRPAGTAEPAYRYIPPEERAYIGKIRLTVDIVPPRTIGEFQRRLDAFLRDRYPSLRDTGRRTVGVRPADRPGEYNSFGIWVNQEYAGRYEETPNAVFWRRVIEQSQNEQTPWIRVTPVVPIVGQAGAGPGGAGGASAGISEPPEVDPLVEEYKKADELLADEMKKPLGQRDYALATAAFKKIGEKADKAFLKKAADQRLAYIAALADQQADYQKVIALGENLNRKLAELKAQEAARNLQSAAAQKSAKANFTATGMLARLKSLEDVDYPIKFKLVDQDNHPLVVLQSGAYDLGNYGSAWTTTSTAAINWRRPSPPGSVQEMKDTWASTGDSRPPMPASN